MIRLATDDERSLREACHDVLAKHSSSARIRDLSESRSGHDAELWELVTGLGWQLLAVPEPLGGLDGTTHDLAVVAGELGRVVHPSLLVPTLAVGRILTKALGEPATQSDPAVAGLVAGIADGSVRATWAVSLPGTPRAVRLTRSGGQLGLHGEQGFVPDVQAATHAAIDVDGPDGRGLLVLALGVERVAVAPMQTMDLTRRYGRIQFDDVPLPGDAVLLPGSAADALFELGVVLQCAESTGVAEQLLDMTVTYVQQREQFGKAIGSFQAIKHRIADMLIETEGCRVATMNAADAIDAGVGVSDAVSIAKSWVGRAASFVATHALQIHGGIGFSWEHDLHLFLRRAKVNELLLGAPAWHDERLSALLRGEDA